MAWTREKPKVHGWYYSKGDWLKDNSAMEVVLVDANEMRSPQYWDHNSEDWLPLPDNVLWAGPIPEPMESP